MAQNTFLFIGSWISVFLGLSSIVSIVIGEILIIGGITHIIVSFIKTQDQAIELLKGILNYYKGEYFKKE